MSPYIFRRILLLIQETLVEQVVCFLHGRYLFGLQGPEPPKLKLLITLRNPTRIGGRINRLRFLSLFTLCQVI